MLNVQEALYSYRLFGDCLELPIFFAASPPLTPFTSIPPPAALLCRFFDGFYAVSAVSGVSGVSGGTLCRSQRFYAVWGRAEPLPMGRGMRNYSFNRPAVLAIDM